MPHARPKKSLKDRILWEEPIRELIRIVGYDGTDMELVR